MTRTSFRCQGGECDSVIFYLNLICVSTYVFIFSYFAFNKTIKSVFRVQYVLYCFYYLALGYANLMCFTYFKYIGQYVFLSR